MLPDESATSAVGDSPTGSIVYGADGDWTGVLAVVRTWLQMIAATTATLIAAAAYQSTCSIDTAPRSAAADRSRGGQRGAHRAVHGMPDRHEGASEGEGRIGHGVSSLVVGSWSLVRWSWSSVRVN